MYILLPLLLLSSCCSKAVSYPLSEETTNAPFSLKAQFREALKSGLEAQMNVTVLDAAPQAALLANSLSFLAASMKDVSLLNNNTENAIRLLTTPGSFRASLYQVVQAISSAFRVAHNSMLAIDLNLKDVPQLMNTLIRAFVKSNEKGSHFLLKLKMKNFNRVVDICETESRAAENAFNRTTDLIAELTQVLTANGGSNEAKMNEAKQRLTILISEKEFRDNKTKEYIKDIDKKSADMNQEKNNFHRTVNAIQNRGFFEKLTNAMFDQRASATDEKLIGSTEAIYRAQLESLDKLKERHEANQNIIADIAANIANTEADKLDLAEIVEYMARGVETLGQIKENWGKLQLFFTTMRLIITGPITTHLTSIEEYKNDSDVVREDNDLLRELSIDGFKAAVICSNVAGTAKIYTTVSKEFVLPVLDGSVAQNTLSKEKAQAELLMIKQKMRNVSAKATIFIEGKLNETRKITDEKLTALMNKFETTLGSLQQ